MYSTLLIKICIFTPPFSDSLLPTKMVPLHALATQCFAVRTETSNIFSPTVLSIVVKYSPSLLDTMAPLQMEHSLNQRHKLNQFFVSRVEMTDPTTETHHEGRKFCNLNSGFVIIPIFSRASPNLPPFELT